MSWEREQIGDCTLYRGDAMEILSTLESVDILATDPPYLNISTRQTVSTLSPHRGPVHHPTYTVSDPWDADNNWVSLAWTVVQKAMFVWTSFHGIPCLPNLLAPVRPKALITWYQRNSAPSSHNAPHYQTEFCWAFSKPSSGLNWRKLRTHLDIPKIQGGCIAHPERLLNVDSTAVHPTQKPVSVFVPLVALGGQSVCDPFMGTGTCGIASMQYGLQFIGIEREQRYFDVACHRIEETYRQGDFFRKVTPIPAYQEVLL